MKTVKIILMAALLALGAVVQGQNLSQQISLSDRSLSLKELLDEIKQNSGISFSYDPRKIPLQKNVSLEAQKGTIKKILDQALSGSEVSYKLVANTVVLTKKETESNNQTLEKSTPKPSKELRGKIIDKATGTALGFANIRLKGTSKGMVSNEEGEFNMRVSEEDLNTPLLISYIGYKNQEVPLSLFSDERLQIVLEANVISLSEVEINPVDPLEVLTEALTKIKNNYPTNSHAFDAYYRELVKVDTSFVKFADAATYIYNRGYTKSATEEPIPDYSFEAESFPFPHAGSTYSRKTSDEVKIIEARASDNLQGVQRAFGVIDFESFSINNGIQVLLGHDYIKTPLQFLARSKWRHFKFTMKDNVYYNDKPVYVIEFSPKGANIKKALVSGKVFIDIKSSAVVAYEFEVAQKLQDKLAKKTGWIKFIGQVPKKLREKYNSRSGFRRKMTDYNHKLSVQFQEYKGKWFLSQVKETSYYHNFGDILEDIYFETTKELIINEILEEGIKEVPRKERFGGQLFSYPTEYNPEFWKNYNTVLPTGVFGKALGDLQKDKTLDEQFRARVTKDTTLTPPIAKKIPIRKEIHEQTLTDNYQWLQEPYEEEVQQHILAENAYTANYMIPLKKLSRYLYFEMVERVKKNDKSVPVKIDDYYYYVRYADSLDYPIFARKHGSLNAEEEIVQDVNLLAEGHDYYSLSPGSPSPDHNLFPFYENLNGGFENVLKFKNLKKNAFISDSLQDVFSMVWFESGEALLYTLQDKKSKRSNQVYLHKLGTPQSQDKLIFEEEDKTFSIDLDKSKSKKYIFLYTSSKNESEVYLIDASQATSEKTLFLAREEGHSYSVDHLESTFYIASNKDAPNFQLLTAPETNWSYKNWKVLIPHQESVMLTHYQLFDKHVVYTERYKAQSYLKILDLSSNKTKTLKFGRQIHVVGLGANPDPLATSFTFEYEDPLTPPAVYSYEFESGERTLIKQSTVQTLYDPKRYKMERIFALSHDGKKIPITLVYRKGATKKQASWVNGKKSLNDRKMYLTGYGAYGISSEPYFSYARISLLNRGVIYAIAHIRGGRDQGENWYQEGKLLNKKNSFKDFISVAEHLIAENYIEKGRIAISGGSAGGLLVGAVVNERPELFKSAILNVPFVDVINTMLNEELPLTSGEYKEWGNPNDKEYFNYMLSFSPYDNVKAQAYPPMLFTCAINDDNVPYWEAVKMVAKLRDYKTDDNEILLQVSTSGGHGGGSRRFDGFRELSREYAFILDLF